MTITNANHHELARYRTIDLTTTGRHSGAPARIEIWWFHVDGRFIITGTPGKRDWLANITANPAITIHSPLGDHPGTAVVVDDPEFRRRVFTDPQIGWYRTQSELDHLVAEAPMIEVVLE